MPASICYQSLVDVVRLQQAPGSFSFFARELRWAPIGMGRPILS
jgi:hypothetical protein